MNGSWKFSTNDLHFPQLWSLGLPDLTDISILSFLTPSFISTHTGFCCVEELFAAGGFVIESQEDFQALQLRSWDQFISDQTMFWNWSAMLSAAISESATVQVPRSVPMVTERMRQPLVVY